MKNIFSSMTAVLAAALIALPACNTVDTPSKVVDVKGDLAVKVHVPSGAATKAESADITAVDGDLSISSLQVLAYNYADGKLSRDLGRKTASITSPYVISTPDGAGLPADNSTTGKRYAAVALVNYADQSAVMNYSGDNGVLGSTAAAGMNLDLKNIFLSQTRSNGILRIGKNDGVYVKPNITNQAAVTADIPAFRAVLRSVEVDLYDKTATLDVKGIMLINVTSKWNLGMAGNPSTFINLAGRKSGASASTSADDFIKAESDIPADYRYLTWKAVSGISYSGTAVTNNQLSAAVYGLPNATSTDSFTGPIPANGSAYTRAVLVATYNGEYCYYPVTINTPTYGKTYDIKMKIRNKGSVDPNDEPKYGALAVTVTVNSWTSGGVFNPEF